jgi:hypothetical protein
MISAQTRSGLRDPALQEEARIKNYCSDITLKKVIYGCDFAELDTPKIKVNMSDPLKCEPRSKTIILKKIM